MEVEIVPDEGPATEKPKRRSRPMKREDQAEALAETLVAPEEVQEVDFGEQDVRAPAHSNGWAAHLVEPTVGDNGPPPELPDEPEYHSHGKGDKPSTAMRLTIAGLYLSFGGLLVYAGAVVLHDLWKERSKE